MKLDFKLGKGDIKGNLLDNREFVITLLIFVGALVLFIFFILPNLLDFPAKYSERSQEIEKLNEIKDAKKLLESTDKASLDSELEIVSIALPTEENFELILGAISEAATRSNAQVSGYSFKQGSARAVEAGGSTSQKLEFEIIILGGVEEASKFSKELSSTYPISNIEEIKYSNNESKITAVFYFKPITAATAKDVALTRQKTEAEKKALEQISEWNLFSLDESFIQQISTESASPF